MKCWMVSDGECAMLCHGETRNQAVAAFIGDYSDSDYSDYARGDLPITTRRIPEHDGNAQVDYDTYAVIRRGFSVYCDNWGFSSGCASEAVVMDIDDWEPHYDDPIYQGYFLDGRVVCELCAENEPAAESLTEMRTP